jgi:hypothetical protein
MTPRETVRMAAEMAVAPLVAAMFCWLHGCATDPAPAYSLCETCGLLLSAETAPCIPEKMEIPQ